MFFCQATTSSSSEAFAQCVDIIHPALGQRAPSEVVDSLGLTQVWFAVVDVPGVPNSIGLCDPGCTLRYWLEGEGGVKALDMLHIFRCFFESVPHSTYGSFVYQH